MNKLVSLKQICEYRPKALTPQAHQLLAPKLNHFKLSPDHTYLRVTFPFPLQNYTKVIDTMTTIGQIADNMDHHPQWTLKANSLQIGLSTHQCQGKVSIKDYILASWIESIWNQKPLEQRLIQSWNHLNINLDQLK